MLLSVGVLEIMANVKGAVLKSALFLLILLADCWVSCEEGEFQNGKGL